MLCPARAIMHEKEVTAVRIVGVIAEYNPFHAGHAWQLREARRLSGADYVVAVMSGCFTQRGEAALLTPADRARMALECGADAVFALPACWAVRDAEHFALGGVDLLHELGCDAISFGAECAEHPLLHSCAALLESPTAAFTGDGAAPGVILVILIGTQAGEIEIDGQKFAEFILPDKLF